ncbi:MAG TPA: bifunctional diaminohydroxyphosphoribosylaminopyrimidine deaminase/5-amino-6-(5-phosphoribosylamino)uracil reductase RibD [Candidatus Hydrogenedentes bacterium]|nr:bifunctional diaminohydroxyphosphoribosylaminopyrimidine deaminase/5-amino-6-(5-phosphoribosylamino)uracil reductase RibD [Candidatus Hydrogenedentota bacterium]HPO85376.1 bifunctional diaminohydroxyphosphoribosylaminopyrimidine deaminase/5-amino-6-(5-phosphoribosylamino)uracil reductase RibD [Candidatus Hydrogenedentota bacterium]
MCDDSYYMRRALELAEKGRGRTSPNPMVGCVIVKDGKVIGEGFHEKAGLPHAEVNAISAAKESVTGATLYVNLEPCCHTGRTPPCTDLIKRHKPARVVVGMPDPNPRVAGQGIFQLREAGIEVTVGVLEKEAARLNEVFIKYITTQMPFVIAKCAMTLDGKIATYTGDSRWVTCEASRRMVHELRNQIDAILVGSRTVMLDDPSLTTRLETGKIKDPIRVIVDADAYLDTNRRVFYLESSAPTWVAVPEGTDFNGADDVLRIPPGPEGVDMRHLMQELARREITSVLIEGGGTTLASAFEADIVDKIMFFVAPKIVGGKEAITAVEGQGIARMADAISIENLSVRPVGDDFLFEGYVKR